MGLTLYIDSYQKEKTCITGYIQCLDCYEVNLDKIKDYKLFEKDYYVSFRRGIHSINELRETNQETHYSFGIGNEFFFYDNASYSFNGSNIRMEKDNTFGVMFEPTNILVTIKKLYLIIDDLTYENIKYYEEKTNLEKLIVFLEEVITKDGMVSFVYG